MQRQAVFPLFSGLAILLLAASLALGAVAEVNIYQMTTTSGGGSLAHGFPVTNWDGTRLAFQSNRDITPDDPGNPDGDFQIYLWDEGQGFRQITNSRRGALNLNAAISADGSTIAFESNADHTPDQPGNPDGNLEIFIWREDTGITQITDTQGVLNHVRAIDAHGEFLALLSSADLTPGDPGNPDGVYQIYHWRRDRGFRQLTSDRYVYFPQGMTGDGSTVVFVSNADLTPGDPGNPSGSLQIFTWTDDRGFRQITNSVNRVNERPSISADGSMIVFRSTDDWTPGMPGNPNGNAEIFMWRADRGFTQITAAEVPYGSDNPVVSLNGLVAFMSYADLTPKAPGNPEHNLEIYVWVEGLGITQVTATAGAQNFARAITYDGTRIPLTSNEDFSGDNPDRQMQVFQAWLTLAK